MRSTSTILVIRLPSRGDIGRVSDYDVALAGDDIFDAARRAGIRLRFGGIRTGPMTDDAREYFERIITQMLFLFPITRDEAVGRANRFWRGKSFVDELSVNMLTHELPEYWAKSFYYGADVKWWLGEDGLEPEPYP
jgi:hypothetical protein